MKDNISRNQMINWYMEMGIDEVISHTVPDRDDTNFQQIETTPNIALQEDGQQEIYMPRKKDTTLKMPNEMENISRALADNAQSLEELKKYIEEFDGLSIKKTATNTVFADGNPNAPFMVIGEAPGANEDIEGIPFCGQSGQLMDKIFQFVGIERAKNLYITNSLFWRPPGNRKPTPEENAVCLPFVEKHIALIKPKLLILVGATSAQTLLNSECSISEMRNKTYSYSNKYLSAEIPVMIMFHPSYLLRQPSQKKHAWNDVLTIKKNYL